MAWSASKNHPVWEDHEQIFIFHIAEIASNQEQPRLYPQEWLARIGIWQAQVGARGSWETLR
jgi:hypothetical protein